jgi:predicted ribosomally synthesized peptide with SipW-like signal peptide
VKKILFSLMTLVLVIGLTGAGAFAVFSDTETSKGNTFTAGTLDLKVGGQDDPNVVFITLGDLKPGWSNTYTWTLKNVGTLPGYVSIEFSLITNNENGVNEPEAIAEAEPYGFQGARATLGRAEGELGEYLKTRVSHTNQWPDYPFVWSTNTGPGPAYAGQRWALDACGGKTYDKVHGNKVTLAPGAELKIFLGLSLDTNLKAWDGCGSHDIDDNVIQSDGVVFNIIFHLDQVP